MRRRCGMFLGTVVRNVFFSFCSLSSSKTPCLPLALLPGSQTCQQAGLHPPAPSLKGHSPLYPHPHSPKKTLFPYKIGQRKRGWGQTFQSILVLQNCLPWLLVGIHTSDWCKIPHSLCFFRTYSLVDFAPQSGPCLPYRKRKTFPWVHRRSESFI